MLSTQKSRDWKAFIKDVRRKQCRTQDTHDNSRTIVARMRFGFSLPKSQYRKRTPRVRAWHTKRPDVDNLCKAIFDACEKVVFLNDTQIVRIVADKIICAQGEAAFVAVEFSAVEPLTDSS